MKNNDQLEWMESATPEQLDAISEVYELIQKKNAPVKTKPKEPSLISIAISDFIRNNSEAFLIPPVVLTIAACTIGGILTLHYVVTGEYRVSILNQQLARNNFQSTLSKTQECRLKIGTHDAKKLDSICGQLPEWKNFNPDTIESYSVQRAKNQSCRESYSNIEKEKIETVCGPIPSKSDY